MRKHNLNVIPFVCFASATVAFQPQHLVPAHTAIQLNGVRCEVDETPSSITAKPFELLSTVTSVAAAATFGFLALASPAIAVSGGGSDFASLDISGQDFSNSNYKGKDFTQVIAKGTTFAKSNLIGCRFYNSYLVNADFEGADARGASFERNNMDGVNLKDANLSGAYFGESLAGVKNLENADFTDASIPPKTLAVICDREDAKGTNPSTGEATRDSLMCP